MSKTSQMLGTAALPAADRLNEVLELQYGAGADDLFRDKILIPAADLLERPSKLFRAQLVELGAKLGGRPNEKDPVFLENCRKCAQVVELLHAGSLVVDDIEDQSLLRRGKPTLHRKYGIPIALNTGNWLYFWPLEIIRGMSLAPRIELELYRHYHRILVKAHCGQALDIGVPAHELPQSEVSGVSLTSLELKSGALVALALVMGGLVAGADLQRVEALNSFGHGLGVALQMFDDLGNLMGQKEPEKKYEDLLHRRVSWVWAFAARTASPESYAKFIQAVQTLPNDSQLLKWLETEKFNSLAKIAAHQHLDQVYRNFEATLSADEKAEKVEVLARIRLTGEAIANGY